ncbi:triose-phosphate transporter family-domain-containing protein [Cunninghamella echinulata]|nr:triose-phosphate transporter family-domain-containing protein [Cunninghamella echinulata]
MGKVPDSKQTDINLHDLHGSPKGSIDEQYENDVISDNEQLLPTTPDTKIVNEESRNTLIRYSVINIIWILSWYILATFLSLYNKWMFSADHYNFQYPLFVTSIHMVAQFFFAGLSLLLFPKLRPKTRPSVNDYIYKVFPCALATSLDIGLSNLSLKTITLSFYTMCKSSTLAFVLLFAFLFKIESPSFKLVGIIIIITSGVVLMVSDETDFVLVGFIQVMLAAAFGGIRWALTEVLLRKESLGLTNPFASIFFLAPVQAIILIVISGIVEGYGTIFSSAFFLSFSEGLHSMGIIFFGGTIAFFMVMSEFFIIKRTSVVTLSVCGIFKEVGTIFISSIVFGDRLTVVNIVGLCITLFGIGLYNWLKMHAATMRVRKQVQQRQQQEDDAMSNHLMADLDGISDDDEDNDIKNPSLSSLSDYNHQRLPSVYNVVEENIPMLLVDGRISNYEDDDNDKQENNAKYIPSTQH